MQHTSYSVSQAAALLGISVPTLKQLCINGRLISFRTPGGHLRVSAESLATITEQQTTVSRTSASPNPLSIRRDRVEEKKLEIEELRLKNEEDRIRSEQESRDQQRRATAREVERKRQAKDQERQREREAHQAILEQRRREDAERRLRAELLAEAEDLLPSWMSHDQREEATEAFLELIDRYGTDDVERMQKRLRDRAQYLVSKAEALRQVAQRRDAIASRMVYSLGAAATALERQTAARRIRDALGQLPTEATSFEEQSAAESAIAELISQIRKREEEDRARQKAESDSRFRDINRQIEETKREGLIRHAKRVAEFQLSGRLLDDDDTDEDVEYVEVDDDAELLAAIEQQLRETITGSETIDQVSKLARRLVNRELDA